MTNKQANPNTAELLDKLFQSLTIKVSISKNSNGTDTINLDVDEHGKTYIFDNYTGEYLGMLKKPVNLPEKSALPLYSDSGNPPAVGSRVIPRSRPGDLLSVFCPPTVPRHKDSATSEVSGLVDEAEATEIMKAMTRIFGM